MTRNQASRACMVLHGSAINLYREQEDGVGYAPEPTVTGIDAAII